MVLSPCRGISEVCNCLLTRDWVFPHPPAMKKHRHTKTRLVSNSRWLAYAAAGAATTLGAAQSAEAEIHYSGPIDARVEGGGRHIIDKVVPLGHNARMRFFS